MNFLRVNNMLYDTVNMIHDVINTFNPYLYAANFGIRSKEKNQQMRR